MDDKRILYPQQPILPIQRPYAGSTAKATRNAQASFGQVLDGKLAKVEFSQHAQQRLQSRNIQLSQEQMRKLEGAVDKAAAKGSRETLVLMDNQMAFLVGVKNRTVITAVDGDSVKENVFTNIDSAVIV
ncbi:TIGR02530 family flagellar biosynthesis protein [Azotosporobacter soli]|uniref:TIGR02530 family flagellar biosynthesis protein n=1 Tax=Azotosporobacter soli TaxID=3055040 RepID=UPI0031FE69D1